jgi:hypothetical protein
MQNSSSSYDYGCFTSQEIPHLLKILQGTYISKTHIFLSKLNTTLSKKYLNWFLLFMLTKLNFYLLLLYYEGVLVSLYPARNETSYSDQSRYLFNILPTKLNTIFNLFLYQKPLKQEFRMLSGQPGLRDSNDLRVG